MTIFIALFEYAINTKQTKLISHLSSKLDEWILAWNAPVESQRLLLRSMSLVLDQEGLASQAVNILIKYFKTYKDDVGSSSSEIYPHDVLELLSTVVINAIKSHVSAFSDRTTLLEVRDITHNNS